MVCVAVLVGLYVVVVMVTVLYHRIVAILKAFEIYDKARERIDGLFQRRCEFVVPGTNAVSTTTFRVNGDVCDERDHCCMKIKVHEMLSIHVVLSSLK